MARQTLLLLAVAGITQTIAAPLDADCDGQPTTCYDCFTLVSCIKIGNFYRPLSQTTCPQNTPYCQDGACVAQCGSCPEPTTTAPDATTAPGATTASGDTTATPASRGFTCTADGYFPDPSNCRRYYLCARGIAYAYECTNGRTLYGHDKAMCVFDTEVQCYTTSCNAYQVGTYQLYQQDPTVYILCTDTRPEDAQVGRCPANYTMQQTGKCEPACTGDGRYAPLSGGEANTYLECIKTDSTTFVGPLIRRCPGSWVFEPTSQRCAPAGPETTTTKPQTTTTTPLPLTTETGSPSAATTEVPPSSGPTPKTAYPSATTTDTGSPSAPTTEAPPPSAPTTESGAPSTSSTETGSPATPTTEAPGSSAPTTDTASPLIPTSKTAPPSSPTTETASPSAPNTETVSPSAPTTEAPSPSAPTTASSSPSTSTTETESPSAPTTKAPAPSATTSETADPSAPTTESGSPSAQTTEAPSPSATTTETADPSTITTQSGSPSASTTEGPPPSAPTTETASTSATTKDTGSSSAPTSETASPSTPTSPAPSPSATTSETADPSAPTTESGSPSAATTEAPSPTTGAPSPSATTSETADPSAPTTESGSPSTPTSAAPSPSATTSETADPSAPTTESGSPSAPTTEGPSPSSPTTVSASPSAPTTKVVSGPTTDPTSSSSATNEATTDTAATTATTTKATSTPDALSTPTPTTEGTPSSDFSTVPSAEPASSSAAPSVRPTDSSSSLPPTTEASPSLSTTAVHSSSTSPSIPTTETSFPDPALTTRSAVSTDTSTSVQTVTTTGASTLGPEVTTVNPTESTTIPSGGQTDLPEDYYATDPRIDEDVYNLRPSFLLGASSSAYQTEGAWNSDGKSPSIQDIYYHSKGTANGDIACDSYNQIQNDISLLKDLGFHTYHLSFSWSRLLPTGSSLEANDYAINFYNNVIQSLTSNGIQPVVTLHHWDTPSVIENGWLNASIADYFVDYATFAFSLFGNRVRNWVLLHDPVTQCVSGYEEGVAAPGGSPQALQGTAAYQCVHNAILAHARAYRAYHRNFANQGGRVGSTLLLEMGQPLRPRNAADEAAAQRYMEMTFAWLADPLTSGQYPESLRRAARDRLPQFTAAERSVITGAWDFFGLKHSGARLCTDGPATAEVSYAADVNVATTLSSAWNLTGSGRDAITPWSLRGALNWIRLRYGAIGVMVTDNGYAAAQGEGTVDPARSGFFSGYLRGLMRAIGDGCKVLGYAARSLTDSFEWGDGYSLKYGIAKVDFDSPARARSLKTSSAAFFQNVLKTRKVDYVPITPS